MSGYCAAAWSNGTGKALVLDEFGLLVINRLLKGRLQMLQIECCEVLALQKVDEIGIQP